jgi:hypothetical protein
LGDTQQAEHLPIEERRPLLHRQFRMDEILLSAGMNSTATTAFVPGAITRWL